MFWKIIGWALFVYGIIGGVYLLANSGNVFELLAGALLTVVMIWGGWKLSHRKA